MATIYKEEYFYNNCLEISPYQLFRNSIYLIEHTSDENDKQELINQLCEFVGMIDFAPLVKDCEKEMKQKGFISDIDTIESIVYDSFDDVEGEEDDDEEVEEECLEF